MVTEHSDLSTRPVTVVIDDGSQTRDTFHIAYPRLDVVGTYPTVEEFLDHSIDVDLVVLDLMLSTRLGTAQQLQGPRAIERLVAKGYRVCLYTDERRPLVLAKCLSAGATGLVRKADTLEVNEQAFLRVSTGQVSISHSLEDLAELLNRRGQLPELTPRQSQVLRGRARGEPWKLLARRLGITPKTGYDRMEAVMAKMVLHLQSAHLGADYSPADVEHALGLSPGDLLDVAEGGIG